MEGGRHESRAIVCRVRKGIRGLSSRALLPMPRVPVEAFHREPQKGWRVKMMALVFFAGLTFGFAIGVCIIGLLGAAKCEDCRANAEYWEMEGRRHGK